MWKLLELQATYLCRSPQDRTRVFVKLRASDVPRLRDKIRTCYEAEATALAVLYGLAVPSPVRLERSELAVSFASETSRRRTAVNSGYIAETYEGRALDGISTPPLRAGTAVGVWLFCVEQFVAFRRHQFAVYRHSSDTISFSPPLRSLGAL